jgi:hypothetical protein
MSQSPGAMPGLSFDAEATKNEPRTRTSPGWASRSGRTCGIEVNASVSMASARDEWHRRLINNLALGFRVLAYDYLLEPVRQEPGCLNRVVEKSASLGLGNRTMTLYLAALSFLLLGWVLMLLNRRDGVTDRRR